MIVRLRQDIRFGLRMLRKTPMLSASAILTFGLGIGLTTTLFSIVNGAFYKGLPFEDADRVVMLWGTNPARDILDLPISVRDYAFFSERQTTLESIGSFTVSPMNIADGYGQPERFTGAQISSNTLEILRVKPVLGRAFQREEGLAGAAPVVAISYNIWRLRFGGSPDVLGTIIRVNGVSRTIVGVMPKGFAFPGFENLWIPIEVDLLSPHLSPGLAYPMFGRLKNGVRIESAKAQAISIAADLEKMYPDTNRGVSATVRPYSENFLRPQIYVLLYTMLGAGIGVLLIACVNVSNLLFARGAGRAREIAIRVTMGASRGRILTQLLTETLLLAMAGGLVGFWFSIVAIRWFVGVLLALNPPPFWITFGLDVRVLMFVAIITLAAGLLAGLLPAWRGGSLNPGEALKNESRGCGGLRVLRFSSALIVAEVAVSCGLLIAAGVMVESIVHLKRIRMPFAVDQVLTARISLPRSQYPDGASCRLFYDRLLPRLQSLADVEAAMLSDSLPASGTATTAFQIQGERYADADRFPVARQGLVTAGYFRGFRTTVMQGREFDELDQTGSRAVALVNASFVRAFFPDGQAVGRSIRTLRNGQESPWRTIVGIVPDLFMEGTGNTDRSPAGFYIPIAQSDFNDSISIAVRTRDDPMRMISAVRAAIASLNPDLPIYSAMSMKEVIRRQSWFHTIFGTLFLALGCSALFLALAGLYAVMRFTVTQRAREMGIRSALGAQRNDLVKLLLYRGLKQLVLGLALGLGFGLVIVKPVQAFLPGAKACSPVMIAIVVASLASSGLIANLVPAWRVTKISAAAPLSVE